MRAALKGNLTENKASNVLKEILKDISVNKSVYLMAIPVIAFYIIFHYTPLYGVIIAFKDFSPFKGIFGSDWVGFKHFATFFSSYDAAKVIRNTILLSFYEIIFGFPAPIILALLLNEIKNKAYKSLVQTISYLPHFVSLVVICGIILEFTTTDGFINDVLAMMGLERSNFLMKPEMFRTVYVSSGIWQHIGWGSIIYLSAISGIDPELYEAAVIDGSGRFGQLMHITLPGIIPTIIILFILRIGHIMSLGWEKVILLYNPLIYDTADIISSYIYRRGLQEFSYSFSAAVGLFNSLINFALLIFANALSRKYSESSLW